MRPASKHCDFFFGRANCFLTEFSDTYCLITMMRIHSNSGQKPSGQKPSGHAVVQHRLLRLPFLSS